MSADVKIEAWNRLVQSKPIHDLGLGRKEGRIDLSGIVLPEPVPVRRFQTSIAEVTQFSGVTHIKRVNWSGLDFSAARLNNVLIGDSTVSDCVFDRCSFCDGGLWRTKVSNTSFREADLRRSAIGPAQRDEGNTFRDVDFSGADMRETAYNSCEFLRCVFNRANLTKVEFQGSRFIDCRFEGKLREVIFQRHGFGRKDLPPNEMARVDFSRAELRYVEFRLLDLDTVRFPEDDDHIVFEDFPSTLDWLINGLNRRTDMPSRIIAAGLANKRKWLGPNQRRGILNKKDLFEAGGESGLEIVLELLNKTRN